MTNISEQYQKSTAGSFNLWIAHPAPEPAFLKLCCRAVQEKLPDFTPITCSPGARIWRFNWQEKYFYHKNFLTRNWSDPIKAFFLGPRAKRALKGHLLLEKYDFAAPRIILMGEKGPLNFIVTQALERCYRLSDFLRQNTTPENQRNKRQALLRFGHTIGRMHRHGISHGDLRTNNVFVRIGDSNKFEFIFLDNERTVRYRRLPARKRAKNLVQLNLLSAALLSRTDRLRFFQAYLRENPRLLPRKKAWLRRLRRKTALRLSRYQKRQTAAEIPAKNPPPQP